MDLIALSLQPPSKYLGLHALRHVYNLFTHTERDPSYPPIITFSIIFHFIRVLRSPATTEPW